MGYHRAGFDVVGVDIKLQKHYPFEFIQADAMTFPLEGFDAIHASPPCQGYSSLAAMHPDLKWEKLIEPVRSRLIDSGLPFVVENVETAPLVSEPGLFGLHGVILCGSSFGLGVERGYLRRHRKFESTVNIRQLPCRHGNKPAAGVYGHGGHSGKHRMLYRKEAASALGIDWMSRDEMCQAIPPAYTEFIGKQLMEHISG